MPRRNNRPQRTRQGAQQWQSEDSASATTEALARDLVERGLASHLILELPTRPTRRAEV